MGPHCVYKFKLPKFQLVTKVGNKGTGQREFNNHRYLTATNIYVLVADCGNNRIAVMDTDLKHKHYIKHQTMTSRFVVKINNNKFYVLSVEDIRCFHVYPLTREIPKIHPLITLDFRGMLK